MGIENRIGRGQQGVVRYLIFRFCLTSAASGWEHRSEQVNNTLVATLKIFHYHYRY